VPLHPQAAAFLARRARDGIRPDHELPVAEVRARADTPPPPDGLEPVSRVEDHRVPGPAGEVPVRVYSPSASRGVVVYLHGGGHVTGTVDSYDGLQVLIYPPVDAVAYRDPDAYPSYQENGTGYGLEYADGLYYWDHYLGPDGDPSHPDASPLRAASLAGLPPGYVLSVEYDVLRDEDRAYADALRAAGVPVEHRRWDGHLHGFLGDPATYDDADPALEEVAAAVRTALES
jgi:acetyl esterase/lipase